MSTRYWARLSFVYDTLGELDRGRVITLHHCRNDDALERLGYLQMLKPDARTQKCPECGAEFIEEHFLGGHMEKRHPRDVVEEAVKEITKEEGQRVINRMIADPGYAPPVAPEASKDTVESEIKDAPLYLDRTEASYKAGLNVTDVTLPPPEPEAPKVLTGVELKKWRKSQGFNQDVAASVLGVGINTVKRAEKSEGVLGHRLGPAFRKVLEATT